MTLTHGHDSDPAPAVSRGSRPAGEHDSKRTTFALIRDYEAGDREAFARLYAIHEQSVRRSIARRLGCRPKDLADVEDVLQETFLAAWKYVDEGRYDRSRTVGGFRNMLVKIAIQKIQDEIKRRGRKKRDETRNVPFSELEVMLHDGSPRPSQIAQGHELEEVTHKAMLLLAESDRWILDCRDNLRMSFREIAEELGCRPVNAKLRYHRATKRYRAAIRSLSETEEPRP